MWVTRDSNESTAKTRWSWGGKVFKIREQETVLTGYNGSRSFCACVLAFQGTAFYKLHYVLYNSHSSKTTIKQQQL